MEGGKEEARAKKQEARDLPTEGRQETRAEMNAAPKWLWFTKSRIYYLTCLPTGRSLGSWF